MSAVLLCCSDLRIDVDGAALIDGLSCSAAPRRVGLIGAWEPLFRYLTGTAELAAGSCQLLGIDARHAVQSGAAAVACYEPPLPAGWSFAEYVARSAELSGMGGAEARSTTRACLIALGLEPLGPRRLSSLSPAERRVLGIAGATVAGPALLLVEAPLADLEEAAAAFVVAVLERAAAERQLLCSARAVPPAGSERGLLDSLDHVLLLEAGRLLAGGPPADLFTLSSTYRVSTYRGAGPLRGELERRGCRVFALGGRENPGEAGSARLLVVLPEGAAPDTILDAALATEAAILEMVPAEASLDALGAS